MASLSNPQLALILACWTSKASYSDHQLMFADKYLEWLNAQEKPEEPPQRYEPPDTSWVKLEDVKKDYGWGKND